MNDKRRYFIICVLVGAVVALHCGSAPALADIYRYVDRDGTMHFTNVPMAPGYRVYIRENGAMRSAWPSNRYDMYIHEAAREHELSFSLIKAVIRAESNFDPEAVSSSGACGLMQIMPSTGEELGISDLFDPRENILGGTRYLKELLESFEGDLELALAAYNAGVERVRSLNGVPPFEETQSFVSRVMEYLERY